MSEAREARTVAEVRVWLARTGRAALAEDRDDDGLTVDAVRLEGGAREVFRFRITGATGSDLADAFGEGASSLLSADDFVAHAEALRATLPLRPEGLVADVVDAGVATLTVALACVHEAEKADPDLDLAPARDALTAQIGTYRDFRRLAAPTRDPFTGPTLPVAERARVEGLAGQPVDALLTGAWRVVVATPARVLARHVSGAVAWADLDDGVIDDVLVVEGPPAVRAWARHGTQLPPRLRHRWTRALDGLGLDEVPRLPDAEVAILPELAGADELVGFFAVQTATGPWREAVLVAMADHDRRITGVRFVEGPAVVTQRAVLAEAADALPGRSAKAVTTIRAELDDAFAQIAAWVEPILAAFADPDADHAAVLAEIRPRDTDYEAVFGPSLAESAREVFAAVWADGPEITPDEGQTNVVVAVCTAGGLTYANQYSQHFHPDFLRIAPDLVLSRTWLTWQYQRPGEATGTTYDGLVWVDDHWAWFPEPYRLLDRG